MRRWRTAGIVAGLLVLALSGCAGVSQAKASSQAGPSDDQATQYLLNYLQQKYQQAFDCLRLARSPGHSPLEMADVFTMQARATGSTSQFDQFSVSWNAGLGSAPVDEYLGVKMRPAYQELADQLVGTVYPDKLLQVDLQGPYDTLGGDIGQADFLTWAATNLIVKLTVLVPAGPDATQASVAAESAGLEPGLAGFQARYVTLSLRAYSAQGFSQARTALNQYGVNVFDSSYTAGDFGAYYTWTA